MNTKKSKHNEVSSHTAVDFEVKPPFQIMEDNRRRFIRIDIEEPLVYFMVKSPDGGFWPDGQGDIFEGEVLNISAGGILMFTKAPIMEGSILSMALRIEGCDVVDNILGIVKRTEMDSDGYLVGVESITREKLSDHLSLDEIGQLPENLASFTERLRSLLNRYIYSKKLEVEKDA